MHIIDIYDSPTGIMDKVPDGEYVKLSDVGEMHDECCKLQVKVNILQSQIREALEMSYVPEGTLLYAAMMKSVSR